MISVQYTRQRICPNDSKPKKGKKDTVCKFCFTSIPNNLPSEEYVCNVCKRKTKLIKNPVKHSTPEPKVVIEQSKKKKKKVKDMNAGLNIPPATTSRPSVVSTHEIKMKNQKKEKLAALLSKNETKKESKLLDFLKLLQ